MPDAHDPDDLETTRQTPAGESPEVVAGRYRILRTLGRGGGGIVWLARDEHLGRDVALKRVAGEADAEVLTTRGLREARTSAALASEHVVRVYDAFVHDGSPWIVMEHVRGPSLSALIEGGRTLPVRQVARIGAQVATALAAAHGAGIVHRDVKPGNVLLTDETGRAAKLTDFGIARAEDDHQLTRTGMVSGTAAYFSPELARGEEPSTASDAWALGATLYTAVEGRRPYPDAGNPVAQLHMIARDAPDAPRQAGELEPVLRGLLDPDPARRWTADRAARALTAIAEGRPVEDPGAAAAGPWATAGEPTEQMRPDLTRRVPVAAPGAPGAPAGPGHEAASPRERTADHTYAAPAQQRPARQSAPAPRRRMRGGVVAAWILGLLLAALLGWLVWTIVDGDRGPDGDTGPSATSTATADQPVSAEEAQETVRGFYAALQDEGLAAARAYLVDGVPVDEAIAEGLESVEVGDLTATELGDGVVQTVGDATYRYGPCTLVQRETMQVARRGTAALVVFRQTETLSADGCVDEGAGDGSEDPADEDDRSSSTADDD
ncbi:hypothetical protein GCM10009584_24820 [Ornithinimicrobium humiphilum]|uniref:non-specific serine/threonine protein kinase n=1 Tax=Ornithinimicrobium humiphilum TaxID=125288 RepID=A0A543KMC7_9MICO|nr:serine/threonine-protein kinase [Ornithinimicrobium humiphilum]TQM96228.1 serine/threonine protein kinase [Ornithinimicrobium humiphilum]